MMTRAAPPGDVRALLAAAALPGRWSGRDAFTVLETDLGDGGALVEALIARRADPRRCARLRWAALSPCPPSRDALAALLASRDGAAPFAAALLERWPCAAPGVHRIELEDGRVRISIAVGAPRAMLPGWVPHADALLVAVRRDAAVDPAVLRAAAGTLAPDGLAGVACVAGVAGIGGTAGTAGIAGVAGVGGVGSVPSLAGTGSSDGHLLRATLDALSTAGLSLGPVDAADGETAACDREAGALAWRGARARGRAATVGPAPARDALVVGAGLAGAACAAALARRGWRVARIDRGHAMHDAGSLQPVLAQHPSVTPDDAPLSRLTRAATLLAGAVAGADALRPVGRVQAADDAFAERATRTLPAGWVRAVDAREASARAGVALRRGGLWLPRACSADPLALREAWTPAGLRVVEGRRVERLVRAGDVWRALDADGRCIAEAPVALLACGADALPAVDGADRPGSALDALWASAGLRRRTGTTTVAHAPAGALPRCIVGGDGHAVPIDATRVLLGPGGAPEDDDGGSGEDLAARAWRRWADRLVAPPQTPLLTPGRPGARLSTRDHLPIAGPVAGASSAPLVGPTGGPGPDAAGLWIAAALGGRGLLWSVLCAELIAASLEHEPSPLERALARHLDPRRFDRRRPDPRARRGPDTAG